MDLLQCIWMFQWQAPYSFLVDSDASLNVVVLCYSIHAVTDQGSMQAPEGGLLLPLCGLQTFCHGG